MADFFFMPTGIGSVPFQDVARTCRDIVSLFPSAPFWPQFVRKSHREDMIIQFSEGLPLLERQEKGAIGGHLPDTRQGGRPCWFL